MRYIVILGLCVAMGACARTQVTRTSANTILIDASAAPACGGQGAAKVAAKAASIETIKAGYDRFIILGGNAQNNVMTATLPGQYNTYGNFGYGGSFRATTTYTPGPVIIAGSHDRTLTVRMFSNGDYGHEQAVDARASLGPDWQQVVKNGIGTCL